MPADATTDTLRRGKYMAVPAGTMEVIAMQVKDIMTKGVEVVRPDATLQETAQKMRSLDIGALPVCDGDKLVGMITDRDITVRATAEGLDPKQTRVREVMSNDLITLQMDQDAKEVAELMQSKQIRRVPVLNRAKQLVGILSLGDLARHIQDSKLAGQTLEQVSEPSRR
jgi:CBS domain-containing protein